MNRSSALLAVSTAAVLLGSGLTALPAQAGTQACPPEPARYSFTNFKLSKLGTNLMSRYITGPGTISYNKTTTATVGLTASASVTAEAGVVVAKASTTAGVALTSQYSRTDGFTYSMTVASGQRRRMRLFQTSRYFVVSKRAFNTHTCTWYSPYSGKAANAPQKAMDEEWLLQA
ncbi:hypothetical protein ABZS29_18310 [Kribbella sp. NPDC005582]|uniref:hypothetical protein n=1 Tax=Kribbella sp. NPDC005582 TaxID=3156893 RepID=UPI0033BCB0FA